MTGAEPPPGSGTLDAEPSESDTVNADRSLTLDHLPVPNGDLRRSRVLTDPGVALRSVLEAEMDGYLTLVPQETLLLGGDARAVITFADGVPTVAYNTETDRGGTAALADVALTGPYRVEVYELPPDALQAVHDDEALAVPPGAPARELADDAALADRTREHAPADRSVGKTPREEPSAVEAFLADEDRIAAIRDQARAEAADRAAEWGLDGLATETDAPETPTDDPAPAGADRDVETLVRRDDVEGGDSAKEGPPGAADSRNP
ncbi:hypothetical protein SAMN05192561_101391 [Halopenitus malekzadehii]|uniref:DUF8054 domain-containing protein n=1 Tax=Halopenitus malekzadehii TaxID=1267564 RepID=A0A1H6HWT8_9EURY|nr:hypothetical protein [Halopenitus malekzadehii]SEH38591.1 hypothetical protein SAMN05192561_101391 [Halopenitus malekzadehii]